MYKLMSKLIDLTGQKFEKLEVIQRMDNNKLGHHMWLCRCDCNNKNEVIVLGYSLKSGNTKSCGCLGKDNAVKHNHKKRGKSTGTYLSWYSMKQRCINPNHKYYHNYGDKGITVCKRWMEFLNFLIDMGERPFKYTLERRDNKEGYYLKNCYWATRKEQARNRLNNLYIINNGRIQLLIEWSEETGIPYETLRKRIYVYGWSTERALTTPVRKGVRI